MTATAPELSKSDFFDFVTSNEVTDAQYKQQMRSVNVFLESPDSRSNPLLSDDPKEQNNNCLLSVPGSHTQTANSTSMSSTTTSTNTLQSFDSIWNVDRDRDRIEPMTMLEDLNKFYWSQDSEMNCSNSCGDTAISNKLISNNTDGQIYTLTVLNQGIAEPSPGRFWVKEEEMSSPADIEQNPSLDLESILDINGFPNDFNSDPLHSSMLPKVESFSYDDSETTNQSNVLTSNSLVKAETYGFEDEYQTSDKKDDSRSSLIETSLLESQQELNNNNDWKLTDQNSESTTQSLLRNALQGKAFIRYTTAPKNVITKLDSNELKKVYTDNNNKADVPSMYQDNKDNADQELLMAITHENSNVNISILLDDANTTVISNGNSVSAQSVDDILLAQLDNYPDDFEKIKRIASELGESVSIPYATIEPIDPNRNVYNIHHVNGELVTMIPTGEVQLPPHLQIVTASPTVTSSKTLNKKHKRVNHKNSPPSVMAQSSTAIQPATSTSNGVRKERSLHYCSICSKGFKDKYSVNVHVRTHTGEKPFSCSLCAKSFRQKAHLAKHYQTHIAQKTAAANGAIKTNNKQR